MNYFFHYQIKLSGTTNHINLSTTTTTSLQLFLFKNTMSAKYVWSSNGTRVLSEDYQETQSPSPEQVNRVQVNQVKVALIELLLKQPNGTKILSTEDKQALLKKAALSVNWHVASRDTIAWRNKKISITQKIKYIEKIQKYR